MSASRIISASLPSFCQKLSQLVGIWRSSGKNNFAQFFWDMVYSKQLQKLLLLQHSFKDIYSKQLQKLLLLQHSFKDIYSTQLQKLLLLQHSFKDIYSKQLQKLLLLQHSFKDIYSTQLQKLLLLQQRRHLPMNKYGTAWPSLVNKCNASVELSKQVKILGIKSKNMKVHKAFSCVEWQRLATNKIKKWKKKLSHKAPCLHYCCCIVAVIITKQSS